MASLVQFWRRSDGGAAVEFAVLTPAYMLMLAGMLAYGLYFGAAHALQQLAADAARVAISGLDAAERDSLVGAYLEANAGAYLLLDRRYLSYTIGASEADPNQYRVELHYDAEHLPIWDLYPPLPLPSRIMSTGSTIRNGGL